MSERSLAYLCLQATTEGQASHAHVREIVNGLCGLGWEVDIFEPSYAGGSGPGAFGRLIEFTKVQRRLIRALRTGSYDALYVRGHALAWPASRAARRLGIPVVQECNGPLSDFYAVWPAARLLAPLLEYLSTSQFREADAVIVVTDTLGEWMERKTGRKSFVIGNGANDKLFRPTAEPPAGLDLPDAYAAFFGSLAPWQEVDVLIDAVKSPLWPDGVSLVMAGDGALRHVVDRAAASSDRILAPGALPYGHVAGFVARSLCSMVLKDVDYDTGPSPLKLYESMACGVPVIATDIAGVREVVLEHECGLLVKNNTPDEVAGAVARLHADTELAARLGENGRAAVEAHYSWKARAAATNEVIVSVLDPGAR